LRIRSSVGQSTSVSSFESDVSLLSPSFTPRVFDDPSFRGISNESNSVVKGLFTVREDSRLVELEVGGINSNGNGLLSDGFG